MGAPYTSTSVSGYNSNPPADDGTEVEANRVKWATIKTKLSDPLNTFASAINNAISTAFGKVVGGAGITSSAISYQILSTDQGKLIRATASGITFTTPDATDVWSPFVARFLNDSDGDVTFDGSGSQTVDGGANVVVPSGCGFQFSTDGTNWFTDGQNFQRTQVLPQGYLTLVPTATDALSPIPATDQSAKTAVYYRSICGDLIPIPDSTNFSVKTFSEMTLTLVSNHVASALYDVFAFDDSGTMRIATGPAWNTGTAGSGARGTGAGTTELTRLKGLPVNNNAITVRNGSTTYSLAAKCGIYLGTIFMDGTNGQISCHVTPGQSRKWGIWNAYNRKPIELLVHETETNWAYSSATMRAVQGDSNNSVTTLCGLAEEMIELEYSVNLTASSTSAVMQDGLVGIGVNSTSSASGKNGLAGIQHTSGTNNLRANAIAKHTAVPAIGINVYTALESNPSTSGVTFLGGSDDMRFSARWMG